MGRSITASTEAYLEYLNDHWASGFVLANHEQERGVVVTPEIMRAVGGNAEDAMIVSQIRYWFGLGRNGKPRAKLEFDGHLWVVKTHEEWQAELGFASVQQVARALKRLANNALLIMERHKSPFHDNKTVTFIRLNWDALKRAITGASGDDISQDNPTENCDTIAVAAERKPATSKEQANPALKPMTAAIVDALKQAGKVSDSDKGVWKAAGAVAKTLIALGEVDPERGRAYVQYIARRAHQQGWSSWTPYALKKTEHIRAWRSQPDGTVELADALRLAMQNAEALRSEVTPYDLGRLEQLAAKLLQHKRPLSPEQAQRYVRWVQRLADIEGWSTWGIPALEKRYSQWVSELDREQQRYEQALQTPTLVTSSGASPEAAADQELSGMPPEIADLIRQLAVEKDADTPRQRRLAELKRQAELNQGDHDEHAS